MSLEDLVDSVLSDAIVCDLGGPLLGASPGSLSGAFHHHLLPQLKALNVQVFEVDTMVPLARAGQALTQCVIKGNLDTMTLRDSSDEEIYRATQTMITESGIQDRLIVSAGCGVPQMTPLENLQAMTRACRGIDV